MTSPKPSNQVHEEIEFERILVPSKDIQKFYHLTVCTDERGKPNIIPSKTNPQDGATPVSIEDFFDTQGPIEVEIGCGKGGFMVDYCEKYPEKPFIGIDQEASIAFLAAKRIAKRTHLPHARVLHGDAFYFLRDWFPENTVQIFHMYFPDPWPKKRHRKRRLLKKEYLEQVRRCAVPGALFRWGTDFQKYHEESWAVFTSLPWIEVVEAEANPTEGIMTGFEKKYREEGRPIYRSVFRILK